MIGGAYPNNLWQRMRNGFFRAFYLRSGSHIRVYEGFGNSEHCFINGHSLLLSPIPRKNFSNHWIINSFSLVRMFMVTPRAGSRIKLQWNGKDYFTTSAADGYFRFAWPTDVPLTAGSYPVTLFLLDRKKGYVKDAVQGSVRIPRKSSYAFISDIDDTFLISHSATKLKRLYVLFTENAYTRKPFEGVVRHYQFLEDVNTTDDDPNPFFYVSSSEWNLHDYIKDFMRKNDLPVGVFLLNQMKTFSKLMATEQNNHGSKFMRIVRLLQAYPEHKFILLGDDSQRDPHIYSAVVSHFPGQVYAVYIRCVGKEKKSAVADGLLLLAQNAVHTCYFMHSADAMKHSIEIGLMPLGE